MSLNAKKGSNLSDVQKDNRSLIVEMICANQGITRTDLASLSGLAPTTVGNIVNQLIEAGVLIEKGYVQTARGRRAARLRFNPTSPLIIGVRLSRRYITLGIFNLEGALLSSSLLSIEGNWTSQRIIEEMKGLIRTALGNIERQGAAVVGIGIAAPGPLIRDGKIVMISNFPGWNDVALKDIIEQEFGLPTLVEHDANTALLAEKRSRPYDPEANMIYVVVGQGIGAGLLINGEIYQGGVETAGEIGHMTIAYDGPQCECGNRGCLEMYCSSRAFLDNASKMGLGDDLTVEDVARMAASGSKTARELLKENAEYLAAGLSSLVYSLGPETIVIGDDMSSAGEEWFRMVVEALKRRVIPSVWEKLNVRLCNSDTDPVLIGTGYLVIEHVIKNPTVIFLTSQ
jgi:N-acetylglucosamine repressor